MESAQEPEGQALSEARAQNDVSKPQRLPGRLEGAQHFAGVDD
jgi:hypothetical protein